MWYTLQSNSSVLVHHARFKLVADAAKLPTVSFDWGPDTHWAPATSFSKSQ